MFPIDGWSAEARFRPRLMSLTSLRDKLLKIGAKVISHGRYLTFQVGRGLRSSRQLFKDILVLIAGMRGPPAPA
jgi:hypothetical protein